MALKKGKTFCIFSAKGGVGKTTTVLNLAGTYQNLNKKVLILDFDLNGGSIALCLNKTPDKTIFNLVDDYTNNHYNSIKDYILTYKEGIDFLASPKDPRQAGKISSSYLDLILEQATLLYDIIIIDTNHVINEMNLMILEKVDNILFLVTNDPMDLKNMKSLISIFKDLKIKNYKVLLNMAREPFKNYYSLYDVKNILKTNIDYTLSSNFYIKNIDDYVINGQIITLDPKMAKIFPKDYTTFVTIATDFLEKDKEGKYGK